MSESRRPSNPLSGAGWTVRRITPRSQWRRSTEVCPNCGATVDLDGAHHQVELDRERPPVSASPAGKLTRERRLLSFCDETCADDWLQAFRRAD